MNRKILLSLGVLVFVGALSLGATGAFFSDSETSTGNTFTAGAIDLKVDSQSHYDGLICSEVTPTVFHWIDDPANATPTSRPELLNQPCDGTWSLSDLVNGVQHFWNFADVKPGDSGENTVSLHIDSNPAWACVDVALTKNDDNTCTEPELGDDPTCSEPNVNLFDGELAQNLNFTAWADDGDNIWEANEPLLFSNISGPASDVLGGKTYKLADSSTGFGPLPGGSTSYIGLAWCAGTQVVDQVNHTITCDGAPMNNAAQTDSMTANVTFRVEQSRNNPNFVCTPPQPIS